jgi:hypothetical protein
MTVDDVPHGPFAGEKSFAGVRECGCVTAALSAEWATQTDVREFYREMADSGREVRRMSTVELRQKLTLSCPHKSGLKGK